MALVTILLCVAGGLCTLIGVIMLVVAAFQRSVLWGVAILLLPFAALAFLFAAWPEARKAFFIQVGGIVLVFAGIGLPLLSGGSAQSAAGTSPVQVMRFLKKAPAPSAFPAPVSAAVEGGAGRFVGMTLVEVRRALGAPKAMLKTMDETTYIYPGLEIISKDGVRVSSQQVHSETRPK